MAMHLSAEGTVGQGQRRNDHGRHRDPARPDVLLPEQRAVGSGRSHRGATAREAGYERVVRYNVAIWHGRDKALHVGKMACMGERGEERVVGEEVWAGNCVEQATGACDLAGLAVGCEELIEDVGNRRVGEGL
jgi:hypothetical protein